MMSLILLSLLLSHFHVDVLGKKITEGFESASTQMESNDNNHWLAIHSSNTPAFFSAGGRVAKYETKSLTFSGEKRIQTNFGIESLWTLNNNHLLTVSSPVKILDFELSEINITSLNLPAYTILTSGAVNNEKLFACDSIDSKTVEFSSASFDSSFYFNTKTILGKVAFSPLQTDAICGPILVDNRNGKVWGTTKSSIQDPLGFFIYLLDNSFKRIALEIPTDQIVKCLDVNNDVVVLVTDSLSNPSSIFIFEIPEDLTNVETIAYSATMAFSEIRYSSCVTQIHDGNGDIYLFQVGGFVDTIDIYQMSKNSVKLSDQIILPFTSSLRTMSVLANHTHGFILGIDKLFKFPVPRYDEVSSMAVILSPLSILLTFFVFTFYLF